ncbi:hypothetical protein [Streptomyces sp. DW26H14]|uniref:hypothetical protein n=1 Tax=Streptomyces sp. DW26H14 TaxID=3435395 RepID=UPI00403DB07C
MREDAASTASGLEDTTGGGPSPYGPSSYGLTPRGLTSHGLTQLGLISSHDPR